MLRLLTVAMATNARSYLALISVVSQFPERRSTSELLQRGVVVGFVEKPQNREAVARIWAMSSRGLERLAHLAFAILYSLRIRSENQFVRRFVGTVWSISAAVDRPVA